MKTKIAQTPITDYLLFKRKSKGVYLLYASKTGKYKYNEFTIITSDRLNKKYSYRMDCFKLVFRNKLKVNLFFIKDTINSFYTGHGYVVGTNDLLIIRLDRKKLFFEFFIFRNFKNYYQLIIQLFIYKKFNFEFSNIRRNKKKVNRHLYYNNTALIHSNNELQ